MTACIWKFNAVLLLLVGWLGAFTFATESPSREAEATLVIFNTRDPESKTLANYYAERRHIPRHQVIGLDCPTTEEISREEFSSTIEKPLRKIFESNGWWSLRENASSQKEAASNRIRFVALMRGMPLKIRTTIPPPEPNKPPPPRPNGGDPVRSHDEASVDSELATLGVFIDDNFGVVSNPYFRRFVPALDGGLPPAMMLVCRLDAPDAETVRRMIDDSLYAEQSGLYGWAYIDRRSTPESGYREGDDWLQAAAAECWNNGVPVILDNMPDVFPSGFPVTKAALYYGWYTENIAGAMATATFARGAVAVHIHSFSAATMRNPNAHWSAPLVARGAAATLGNVYEPYLTLTAHLDIFNDRLLNGFTLAESSYMSLRALSWMNVIIGDPLYKPFAKTDRPHQTDSTSNPWALLSRQLHQSAHSGLTQAINLGRLARTSPSGLNYEALGMLESFFGQPREALVSLESAGQLYGPTPESFRTVIERVRILQSIGDKNAALKLIDSTARRPQPPDRAKLLTALRNEISPPPPPPSITPKKP
jgi:uncharacterized protein (TIGR03790 family)